MGAFYVVVAVVAGLFEETLRSSRTAPDLTLTTLLFVLVMIGNLAMVAAILLYFLGRLGFERERAEGLLLNVLPAEVASELKEKGKTTAQHFDSVSVLFADIVGFTPMSAAMEPEEMVGQLNDVFTYFDQLAERYGCEKIRTIGDNYMVASGLPTPRDDHAQTLCAMAVDMLDYSKTGPLSFRLGINSGPVVAGVIGTKKFQYDMWGDTVNTASRMESHGEADQIQIAEATYALIKDDFATTPRGAIEVKGKGTLNTYWLEASREPPPLLLSVELQEELDRSSWTFGVEVGRCEIERGRHLEFVPLEQRRVGTPGEKPPRQRQIQRVQNRDQRVKDLWSRRGEQYVVAEVGQCCEQQVAGDAPVAARGHNLDAGIGERGLGVSIGFFSKDRDHLIGQARRHLRIETGLAGDDGQGRSQRYLLFPPPVDEIGNRRVVGGGNDALHGAAHLLVTHVPATGEDHIGLHHQLLEVSPVAVIAGCLWRSRRAFEGDPPVDACDVARVDVRTARARSIAHIVCEVEPLQGLIRAELRIQLNQSGHRVPPRAFSPSTPTRHKPAGYWTKRCLCVAGCASAVPRKRPPV